MDILIAVLAVWLALSLLANVFFTIRLRNWLRRRHVLVPLRYLGRPGGTERTCEEWCRQSGESPPPILKWALITSRSLAISGLLALPVFMLASQEPKPTSPTMEKPLGRER